MLRPDVVLDGGGVDGAVRDVLVGGPESAFARAAKRPVVAVVPVLELHAVDVAAVEPLHLGLRLGLRLVAAEGRHEAVAGEARPVGADIDGNCCTDVVGLFARVIDLHHIAPEVFRRCRPGPVARGEECVGDDVAQETVADARAGWRCARHRQCHRLARHIAALVRLNLVAKLGQLDVCSRSQPGGDGTRVGRLLVGLAVQRQRAACQCERSAVGACVWSVLVQGIVVIVAENRADSSTDRVEAGRVQPLLCRQARRKQQGG